MIYNLPQVKKAAGETWVLHSSFQAVDKGDVTFPIGFTSNGSIFSRFTVQGSKSITADGHYDAGGLLYDSVQVYAMFGVWTNEAYRTVTFLEPPTGDLLAWLQVNAVKQ